jgi:hypothetical protein
MKKSNTTIKNFHAKPKRKRKGVHAKSKSSRHKASKNYLKRSRGQG